MAKSNQPKSLAPLPVLSREHELESESRSILQRAIRPWPVTNWDQHDYGIDAVVEIVKPNAWKETSHLVTGRRVALQLKASDSLPDGPNASVRVRVASINYWLASSEPLAVVFCHPASELLVYRWIDEEVLAGLAARSPAWATQETVTLHIPVGRVLNQKTLVRFAREARDVAIRRHRVLAPGTYADLLSRSTELMDTIGQRARAAGFESITRDLSLAAQRVAAATYVIAIAGRMRAGKSTLLNAMAGRDVSPVGRRPTTAVPIVVSAGSTERATIVFEGGKRIESAATASELAKYSTQEENPHNQKQVRHIDVRIRSSVLERGFALVDAPGLFDPSPVTREITARTLGSANAVLFVMDVSAAQDGGFAVDHHVLEELKRVLQCSERVFILLNKADRLGPEDRDDVSATLQRALGRDLLESRLASPPLFISARDAWEWVRDGAEGDGPLESLDRALWEYLLSTNSTGVARLETAVGASSEAVVGCLRFAEMRRASSQQATSTRERLDLGREEVEALIDWHAREVERISRALAANLLAELWSVPERVVAPFRGSTSVPGRHRVRTALSTAVSRAFSSARDSAEWQFSAHGGELSRRLEGALDQVRVDYEPLDVPSLGSLRFEVPKLGSLPPEALSFATVASFLTYLIAPASTLWGAFLGFLLGGAVGQREQTARELEELREELAAHVRRELVPQVSQFEQQFRHACDRLARQVSDRWRVFESDSLRQIDAAGTPLSDEEADALQALEEDLRETGEALAILAREIRWRPTS